MGTGNTVFVIWMLILTPISVGTTLVVAWWFMQNQDNSQEDARVSAIWNQRGDWGEAQCRQLIDRHIDRGMTPDMVRLAWGEADEVTHQRDESGQAASAQKIWHYAAQSTKDPGRQVVFQNGVVHQWDGQVIKPGLELGPWQVITILLILAAISSLVVFAVLIFTWIG